MAPELVQSAFKSAAFTKPATLPSRAYVTFLAGDGDYIKGVVGLAKGLRKVKFAYPLVVAVLPDVPVEHRRILESQGCIVREIEPVHPLETQTQFAMAYYVINYSNCNLPIEARRIPIPPFTSTPPNSTSSVTSLLLTPTSAPPSASSIALPQKGIFS